MRLKLLAIALGVLLGTETILILILLYRRPAHRFKPVEGYEGLVAFDTASGQLCKTIATKSAQEIARQTKLDAAREQAEATKRAESAREKAARTGNLTDEIVASIDEQAPNSSRDASTEEFVARLPACKDVR